MSGAFILSGPRTGSTLLRWIIDVHPEVTCPPETQISRALEAIEPFVRATSAIAVEDEAARQRFIVEETRRIVTEQLEAFVRHAKKRIWCEKTPTLSVFGADKLYQYFPDARYFCLYRGCLDFVHSCIEHSTYGFRLSGTAPYVARNPENVVEALTVFWCDITEKELAFEAAHPNECMRVRYEDVVLDTDATAPRIFAHLGVDYSKELLEKIFTVQHAEGMGDPKIHYTKRIEDGTGRGDILPITRITPGTRARADALAERLEYPPIGTPPKGARAPAVRAEVADFFQRVLPARLAPQTKLAYTMQSCRFLIKDGALSETWHVDLMGAKAKIRNVERPADVTFELAPAVLLEMAKGKLNFVVAKEDGRLVLHGDRTLASRFYHVLFV